MYASRGRPSIPPEHLLKGSLLIALFSVRSERQFCEQLRYNLLFKWFLDLNVEDEPFNATTFSKNRERLLEAEVARAFFSEMVAEAGRRRLLWDDHFSVDGTLLEAWASLKSYRPRTSRTHPRRAVGATRRWTSGAAAQSRDARLAHGCGGAALPQGPPAGGEAELSGPRPQREPSRAGGGRGTERGERLRRARGGPPDAVAERAWSGDVGGPTAGTTRATSCGRTPLRTMFATMGPPRRIPSLDCRTRRVAGRGKRAAHRSRLGRQCRPCEGELTACGPPNLTSSTPTTFG